MSTVFLILFLVGCGAAGLALVFRVARALEEAERLEILPLHEADRWRLRIAITLLDSALHEITTIAERNGAVGELEGMVARSLSDARRILNESRRIDREQRERERERRGEGT